LLNVFNIQALAIPPLLHLSAMHPKHGSSLYLTGSMHRIWKQKKLYADSLLYDNRYCWFNHRDDWQCDLFLHHLSRKSYPLILSLEYAVRASYYRIHYWEYFGLLSFYCLCCFSCHYFKIYLLSHKRCFAK